MSLYLVDLKPNFNRDFNFSVNICSTEFISKLKILVFMLAFFSCLNVYAIDACTTSEMSRLRELANNIQFKTDMVVEMDDKETENYVVSYNVEIANFDDDLKIGYKPNDYSEEITVYPNQIIDEAFYAGQTIKFKIYAYTENLCIDELLKTVTVKFPYVNEWYHFNKEKCEDNPDFKYCKEFMNVDNIDFEDIDKEFDAYLKKGNITSKITNNLLLMY